MKTCLLCPATVPARHRLCYPCFRQYRDQMHESWFLALVELQKVQDRIDDREQYTIDSRTNTNLYGVTATNTVPISKRSVGRPRTNWKLVEEILRLYDESLENGQRLSVRTLEKMIDRRVKFLTIWNILKKYRKRV